MYLASFPYSLPVKFPNFHTYSITHVDVLFCIVLYRQRFFNLPRIIPTSANALSCSSPRTLASL